MKRKPLTDAERGRIDREVFDAQLKVSEARQRILLEWAELQIAAEHWWARMLHLCTLLKDEPTSPFAKAGADADRVYDVTRHLESLVSKLATPIVESEESRVPIDVGLEPKGGASS